MDNREREHGDEWTNEKSDGPTFKGKEKTKKQTNDTHLDTFTSHDAWIYDKVSKEMFTFLLVLLLFWDIC